MEKDQMIELLKAARYYPQNTPGWVVLNNGHPSHFLSKKEAEDFINRIKEIKNESRRNSKTNS